jgi:hypothetical protein
MRAFNFKLILLIALFIALVVKGGQLCTAEGVQAMTRLVEPGPAPTVPPLPLRPIEEEFRGVSPLPDLAKHALPSRKLVKSSSAVFRKLVKTPLAAKAPVTGKPTKKS